MKVVRHHDANRMMPSVHLFEAVSDGPVGVFSVQDMVAAFDIQGYKVNQG